MTSVSVHITVSIDDAFDVVGGGFNSGASVATAGYSSFSSQKQSIGLRFRSVGILASATVSAATLTVNVTNVKNVPVTTLYGVKATNAAIWADPGNRPSNIVQTTASVNVSPTATGTNVYDVSAVITELVGQSGWSSTSPVAFAMVTPTATPGVDNYYQISTIDAGTSLEAVLDITFTGGNPDPIVASGPSRILSAPGTGPKHVTLRQTGAFS